MSSCPPGTRAAGSSPLARGLPHVRTAFLVPGGIIPARAGFTPAGSAGHERPRDHPRSRGVYATEEATTSIWAGSSPLARGLHVRRGGHHPSRRIIPARAGFTGRRRRWSRRCRDHPRSRGVYSAPATVRPSRPGSSPLARGLLTARMVAGEVRRIIPARAGFTRTIVPDAGVTGGSSPLARGLRFAGPRRRRPRWIIPARAGFTPAPRLPSMARTDHPRSRGVYMAWISDPLDYTGSSPLARGLRRSRPPTPHPPRIIPARAGFTTGNTCTCSAPGDHPRSRGVYLADPWNPNEPALYQTPAAFTADPGPAPPGRESSAVVRGAARR